MKLFTKIALSLVLGASLGTSAFASVTQSTTPAGSDSFWNGNGWAQQQLGSVTLAQGTNNIISLTSTVTLKDQGWGGQDPTNGVVIGLFDNGTSLWSQYVAGATHSWSTQTFDITNNLPAFSSLQSAIGGIDWSNNPTVTLQMFTTPWAFPGWELHTQNASFSVTSSTVPEPASLTLLALGLAGLGLSRRKTSKQ